MESMENQLKISIFWTADNYSKKLTLEVPRGAQKGHHICLIRNTEWILLKFAEYKVDSMFIWNIIF
jgi:hypothetical protein